MNIKSVKTIEIKEVGTINLAGVKADAGQISVHIPVTSDNRDFIQLIDTFENKFRSKHPEVKEEETCVDITVVYSFGGYETGCNTDFTLSLYIWQESNEDNIEVYDDIPLYLDKESCNTMKKVLWDALGKMLLNI